MKKMRDKLPRRLGQSLLLAAATAMGAGCGAEAPQYPVRGKVVYADDGGPVPAKGIEVWFESTHAPYLRAMSELDEKGEFSLSAGAVDGGTLAGTHRVRFLASSNAEGESDGGSGDLVGPGASLAAYMDPKYSDFQTSGIEVTVEPESDNYLVIEVEKVKSRR